MVKYLGEVNRFFINPIFNGLILLILSIAFLLFILIGSVSTHSWFCDVGHRSGSEVLVNPISSQFVVECVKLLLPWNGSRIFNIFLHFYLVMVQFYYFLHVYVILKELSILVCFLLLFAFVIWKCLDANHVASIVYADHVVLFQIWDSVIDKFLVLK